MELNINSIADIFREDAGWTVKFPSMASKERLIKADKGLVVSVMGIYNRGKTWLVNRLAGSKFSDGYLVHTNGLSVKTSGDKSNLLFIDTAGANQPVTRDEVDNRAASEYFLQKLVLHLSDAVLIVLDALTLHDQRYIHNLRKAIDRGDMFGDVLKRNIYIIHNYKALTKIEDVEEKIKKDIIKCFGAQETHSNKKRYWKSSNGSALPHVVFAQHDTPAGDNYNENSTKLLLSWLESVHKEKVESMPDAPGLLDKIEEQALRILPHLTRYDDPKTSWEPNYNMSISETEVKETGAVIAPLLSKHACIYMC